MKINYDYTFDFVPDKSLKDFECLVSKKELNKALRHAFLLQMDAAVNSVIESIHLDSMIESYLLEHGYIKQKD